MKNKIVSLVIFFVLVQYRGFGQSGNYGMDITALVRGQQSRIDSTSSLDNYIKLGWKRNPGVNSAFNTWQASVNRIAASRGLPGVSFSAAYFFESIQTRTGPQDFRFSVTQVIPWFGKLRTQGNIQFQQAEAELQDLKMALLKLQQDITKVYFDLYFLERSRAVTATNLELVKNWEKVLLSKYRTASAGHPNLITTQIEYIKLQDDLKSLDARKEPLLQDLRSLLDMDSLPDKIVPDSLEFISFEIDRVKALEKIKVSNPVLQKANTMILKKELQLKHAKLSRWPDLGAGIDYIATGDSDMSVSGSGKDPVAGMLTLRFSAWPWTVKKQIEAANKDLEAARLSKLSVENDLKVQYESLMFMIDDSRRKIELYRDSLIPKSLESLRASERGYISDQVDFIHLVDAQRRYLQFQLEYQKSLVEYFKNLSKIKSLLGEVSL